MSHSLFQSNSNPLHKTHVKQINHHAAQLIHTKYTLKKCIIAQAARNEQRTSLKAYTFAEVLVNYCLRIRGHLSATHQHNDSTFSPPHRQKPSKKERENKYICEDCVSRYAKRRVYSHLAVCESHASDPTNLYVYLCIVLCVCIFFFIYEFPCRLTHGCTAHGRKSSGRPGFLSPFINSF